MGTDRDARITDEEARPERRGGTAELSRDEIVRALEDDIMDGTIQPGERVDERLLAERFGVSRAPVRDAIGRLASLGLIDVRPRSGSYVTRLDVANLFQLFEVMAELEGICASYAAQRMDPEERAELRGIAEAGGQAATAGLVADYALTNNAFHEAVYRGAKNPYLEKLTRQARMRIQVYRTYTLRLPGRLRRSADEHFAICNAISEGEAESARSLMLVHVDIKRSDYTRFIAMMSARGKQHGG